MALVSPTSQSFFLALKLRNTAGGRCPGSVGLNVPAIRLSENAASKERDSLDARLKIIAAARR